jgi:TM2 domain-containing membrane protein YozV
MSAKVWVLQGAGKTPQVKKERGKTEDEFALKHKNPAVAYSLSLLLWGAGQIYNGQTLRGSLFILSMLIFYTCAVLFIVYVKPVLLFLRGINITNAEALIMCQILIFSALTFWSYNAGNAYHKAKKMRVGSFTGVKSCILPLICSLLVPGWGQFLNGQPKKGSIFTGFLIITLFTIILIPLVIVMWPSLEASNVRLVIETILAVSLLFSPFIILIWLLAIYDALKVSNDEIKKESFIKRIQYANNRRRLKGWRGILKGIRTTLTLFFVLIILTLVGYHYFPGKYYSMRLKTVQSRLYKQDMIVVPYIIERSLDRVNTALEKA